MNATNEMKWICKKSQGKNGKRDYDVTMSIYSRKNKSGGERYQLSVRFSNSTVVGDYVVYAYDPETKRMFFAESGEEGFKVNKNGTRGFLAACSKDLAEELRPYAGSYNWFDYGGFGEKYIQLGAKYIQLGE